MGNLNKIYEKIKKSKKDIDQKLQLGYVEMAEINANYAEMCLEADNSVLASCEEKLSESE